MKPVTWKHPIGNELIKTVEIYSGKPCKEDLEELRNCVRGAKMKFIIQIRPKAKHLDVNETMDSNFRK